ncbi:GGDEF domain-containing protein [Arcobacter sp. LA11]|uniref:GGDEF domain-containing protein n=1 Tax=Arcobacter sp. LA11 TaxID=1898176 RepID=UPI000934B074|nr:GGDEF domain-containing protein [Arcobacter sp. LA11]
MKRETIKMIAAVGFTLAILTAYSVLNYFYEKNRLIAQIDKQLYSAAVAVPFVLVNDFHDRTTTSTSISISEDNQNIKNLSKLNNQLGTKFLYTVIRDINGIYRISSSSALASEIAKNKEVRYFTPYPDASEVLKKSFENPSINFIKPNKIYKAQYVPIFSDRWGTYRSIVLPIRTLKGKLYVVGVDMDITYVNTVLKENTIKTILSFFLFLISIIPIVITYNLMLKRKQKEYQEVHKLYIDKSKLSITDPLTKLYNRYKLDYELELQYNNLQRGGNPFSLLILDIDHFKNINDQYGHQTGDQVLQLFADILKKNSRITDTVGRWGGEEFMVIYPNSDLEKGFILAEKLRLSIMESKETQKYNLTVSIGVGVCKKNINLDQFLKKVDETLYQAKKMGRNQTIKVI